MKPLISRVCAVLVLALLAGPAVFAARVTNLFQAEVAAQGRDNAARDAALGSALKQVLERVTGEPAGNSAGVQTLLEQPGRFVDQYRFEDDQYGQLRLWVQFDGVALENRLRELGVPFWGGERPDVLLWLAIDDRGSRYLVSETSDNVGAVLARAAHEHGLPLTLPLMDLEDQRALEFTDVWGGFLGAIQAASRRYRPQVILIGKLGRSRADGSWLGGWTLAGAGASRDWNSSAASLEQSVEQGIEGAAGRLAAQYAVVSTGRSVHALVVDGIEDLPDYARVYNYLASLTPVDGVQVRRVSGREMEFELSLSSDERSVLQLITLGKVLEARGGEPLWNFRLRR
jgi:hypothetical protein